MVEKVLAMQGSPGKEADLPRASLSWEPQGMKNMRAEFLREAGSSMP
jgi:hypothetical protein